MRTVIVYAALLGSALVGSYLSWTAEDTEAAVADVVPVYRATKGEVTALAFHNDDVDVRLERREDDRGAYTWLTVEERRRTQVPVEKAEDAPEPPEEAPDEAPEAGTPDAPADAPEMEERIEIVKHAFTGSEAALKLLEDFEPLQAKRELEATLTSNPAFGFDEPQGTVTVTRKNSAHELVVGGSTYGTKDRYVKHDGRLFLLQDKAIRPLQFAATRLKERRPQPFETADLESLDVTRAGSALSLEQRNRADRAKAFWTRSGEEEEDDAATTWVDKMLRLKTSNANTTPEGALEPLLTVSLTSEGTTWTVTLASDGTEDGRFVQSDFLRGSAPVAKALADEIIDDLDQLLAN